MKAAAWEIDRAPAEPKRRAEHEDDLGGARGIFTAVVAGFAIWLALAWGAMIMVDRLIG